MQMGNLIDTACEVIPCRHADRSDLDITEFARDMFKFSVGGRMVSLFDSKVWGPALTMSDRLHIAESAQVREFCVVWPQAHTDKFDADMFYILSKFCNGKPQEARKLHDARLKKENSSENRPVSLSGNVDVVNLPARKKSRRVFYLLTKMSLSQEAARRRPEE